MYINKTSKLAAYLLIVYILINILCSHRSKSILHSKQHSEYLHIHASNTIRCIYNRFLMFVYQWYLGKISPDKIPTCWSAPLKINDKGFVNSLKYTKEGGFVRLSKPCFKQLVFTFIRHNIDHLGYILHVNKNDIQIQSYLSYIIYKIMSFIGIP